MNCVLELFLCFVVLVFPLMIFIYYVLYKKNYKEKEKEIILDIVLYFSLFLIINLLIYFDSKLYFILCTIPILLSYIYRRNVVIFINSTIVSIYIMKTISISILLIIVLNILYFVIYTMYMKSNKKLNYLFCNFSIITISLLSINFVIRKDFEFLNIEFLFILIIYILMLFILYFVYKKTNEIVNVYMTLDELKHENKITTSLFKITHEIKNPLAVISGYIQLYDVNNIEKSKKYISIINEQVEHILNLLDDFKEFTKINIKMKEISFTEVMESISNTVLPLAKKKKINIQFKIEDNIHVFIDPLRIKQVLINLIKNSIEACCEKGKIFVYAYVDDKNLHMDIIDDGKGMSKETMDNILKPFFTTKEFGTGLGITLSNEIILAHNGKMTFYSEVGKGTTFKIVIPK